MRTGRFTTTDDARFWGAAASAAPITTSAAEIPFVSMRLLYKPIDLLLGRIASRLSRRLFRALWSVVDEHDPPRAGEPQASWPKLLGASALQAMSSAVTHTTADRLGASAFHWLTGSWPTKRRR